MAFYSIGFFWKGLLTIVELKKIFSPTSEKHSASKSGGSSLQVSIYVSLFLCKFLSSALWGYVMVITSEIQPSNQKLVWKRRLISPCDILADVMSHFFLTNVTRRQCSALSVAATQSSDEKTMKTTCTPRH